MDASDKQSSSSKRKRSASSTNSQTSHNHPNDPSPKVKEASWSKAAGLDLRWDKPKIYKSEVGNKDPNDVPVVKEAQKHICQDRILKERPPPEDPQKLMVIKSKALRKMKKAFLEEDREKLTMKFLKVESLLFQVILMGGHYEAEEADDIVDFFLLCREREGIHPLQRSRVRGPLTNYPNTPLLFMHQPLRDALQRKGFYLNVGYFSSAESLTLMKNFERFLLQNGFPTDKENIWKCLSVDFHNFHLQTKIFTYIGENLNRTSRQLYRHLQQVYHPYQRGSIDAATDAVLLEESARLDAMGSRNIHKKLEKVVNRHRGAVCRRLQHLTGVHDATTKSQPDIYKAISQFLISSENVDTEAIPFEDIGARLGFAPEVVEKFWLKVGKSQYERSLLQKWTLQDSLTLLDEVQRSEEDDENAIDFGGIKTKCFEGKVVNLQHLREHFNRLRRAVPYYMLSDLQSVVSAAKKQIETEIKNGRS